MVNELNRKKASGKKFVRYSEATEMYGMGLTKLKEIANGAGAVYKLGRLVLLDTEKLEDYIRTFEK